jgi:hypothetical protein
VTVVPLTWNQPRELWANTVSTTPSAAVARILPDVDGCALTFNPTGESTVRGPLVPSSASVVVVVEAGSVVVVAAMVVVGSTAWPEEPQAPTNEARMTPPRRSRPPVRARRGWEL